MMFKLIILLAAAVPVVLLVNRMFFRRSPRIQKAFTEFRRQVDFAAWALLGLAAIAIVYSLAKLVYGMWG
jgi:hypothetical protein